ncbi:MAG: glycosyltransferase family 4 protein [Candidatus Dormibacterales bacterium]
MRFTGYLTDRQLAAVYRRSRAFAFPSLFEGFGLPVLEAMAHGVPVACSTGGAIPEVAGEAALLFDPLDVDSMTAALRTVLTDEATRCRLAESGPRRAQLYSWERTAALTMAVYDAASRDAGRRGRS